MAFMNSSSTDATWRSAALVENGVTTAHFEVQGVAGSCAAGRDADEPHLQFERLDLKRAPAVLAVAGALLPANGELPMTIDDLRYADHSLGALQATSRGAMPMSSFRSIPGVGAAPARRARPVRERRNTLPRRIHGRHAKLAALLGGVELPAEWPTETLHAAGELTWPADSQGDLTRVLAGRFALSRLPGATAIIS